VGGDSSAGVSIAAASAAIAVATILGTAHV
jgi:hypothetical protein